MITNAAPFQIQGRKTRPSEDRYRLLGSTVPLVARSNRGHLYAVMDGVGTAPLGRRTAQLVADRLIEFFTNPQVPATADGLSGLLNDMNLEVHGWGTIEGTDRPKGAAAVTVGWFSPQQQLLVFHAGDTSAARFDGEHLQRLTPEHAEGGALTRYLGQGPGFVLDRSIKTFDEGDLLCLATDGLTKAMGLDDIEAQLQQHPRHLETAARELAEHARASGCLDDITVVVVELEEW